MNLIVTDRLPYDPPVEFVERKGTGHPDTICDHLAEELARDLARSSLEQTGRVQHFNVDKAIFAAGSVDVDFGGGEHTKRSKLVLVGKVDFTDDWNPDPSRRHEGDPFPSILGKIEPPPEGLAAAQKVWREMGYEGE